VGSDIATHRSPGRESFRLTRWRACLSLSVVLTGALILTGPTTAKSREISSPDTQEWNEIDVTVPLPQRLELTWVSLARLSSNIGRPVTYANGLYAGVAIGDHLTVTPSYSQYEVFSGCDRR
jgi:hypothetical protein